jgi:hypothetical protein
MLKTVSAITNAIGALNYKGTWNASTNTPALASGVGTKGDYYVVSVAGTTTLDGISNWGVGDWAAFNGSAWQRVEGGADLNGVNVSFTGTASGPTYETSNTAAGLTISNNDIVADGTDVNIDIDITPKGTGEVNLPKVDIDGGAIDGTPIGANSASTGKFTTIETTGAALIGTASATINQQVVQANFDGTGVTKAFVGVGDTTITTNLQAGRGIGGAICFIRGYDGSTGASFSRLYILEIRIPGGAGGVSAASVASVGGSATFTFGLSGSDIQITSASTNGGAWYASFIGL